MSFSIVWDVIVVGGGHAGCEAALAAARKNCRTLLLTLKRDRIGVMSCNPAIGGIGKGQLVSEIDAMGGMMGLAADYACIQYRLLNRRKGAAVHGPRGQADRALYQRFVQQYLEQQPNLDIVEGECADLIIDRRQCSGIITAKGEQLHAKAVVLTTGTFLRGIIYQGKKRYSAGRAGEKAADLLSAKLMDHGLSLGRLKTGTPSRLYKSSIDYKGLAAQPADEHPRYFSLMTTQTQQDQIDCHITHTQPATHDIIRANLDVSPVYRGEVTASGPRYCPSIEDKIHRFAEKLSHQIFLEPEGLGSDLVYPNGISTSLSVAAQEAFLRTIPGLKDVRIAEFGYAIEYDFIDPLNLNAGLEVNNIAGLFLAGQINGSTGYEEAAAQGLMAGLNAANTSLQQPPFHLARYEGYIGVMIDDMTHKGVSEPYRMFTSRAEFRLQLRSDNAPHRLCAIAQGQQCLDDSRWQRFEEMEHKQQQARNLLKQFSASPHELQQAGIHVNHDGVVRTAEQLLANQVPFEQLTRLWPSLAEIDQNTREFVWNSLRYAHYSSMQEREIERLQREASMALPATIDYAAIDSLSHEVRQILQREKPPTLGAAARLQGVTPSALVHLMVLIESGKVGTLKNWKF